MPSRKNQSVWLYSSASPEEQQQLGIAVPIGRSGEPNHQKTETGAQRLDQRHTKDAGGNAGYSCPGECVKLRALIAEKTDYKLPRNFRTLAKDDEEESRNQNREKNCITPMLKRDLAGACGSRM
jgi:hypothetical protein